MYDCAPVSLLNAFRYLLNREDLPALVIKKVYSYTLDLPDNYQNIGNGGTSKKAMKDFVNWINPYAYKNNLNITLKYLEGECVTFNNIAKCLKENGCILIRCWQTTRHYALITKMTPKKVYIFDPYYIKKLINKDQELKLIFNKPFKYNRIITSKRLFSENEKDFSLGKISLRECILVNKTN